MANNEFLEQLLRQNNGQIPINIYQKKDPEQNYGGFGYALNNLMRNPNLFNQNRQEDGDFAANDYNPLSKMAQIGLPFAADMLWGNKYRNL